MLCRQKCFLVSAAFLLPPNIVKIGVVLSMSILKRPNIQYPDTRTSVTDLVSLVSGSIVMHCTSITVSHSPDTDTGARMSPSLDRIIILSTGNV